jgi:DNA-binding NarL/FixJ family response regulator
MMHFRAKELDRRSAFPAKEVGKSGIDAWNHERVYLSKPAGDTLADFLLPMRITPLDYPIANDFIGALTVEERHLLDDLTAGFKMNEIAKRNHLDNSRLQSLRHSIQKKAHAYL